MFSLSNNYRHQWKSVHVDALLHVHVHVHVHVCTMNKTIVGVTLHTCTLQIP